MSEEQKEVMEDRRRQGIRVKIPGGPEIEVRGLTTIVSLLLVLTAVNSWIGWTLVQQMERVGDAITAQSRVITMQTCVAIEFDPSKRRDRYDECLRWFK